MPNLRVGTNFISNLRLGATQVSKLYLGTTEMWAVGWEWIGTPATISFTARSSTWGPALVPSGRTAHWDASHEASFTYRSDGSVLQWEDLSGNGWWLISDTAPYAPSRVIGYNGIPVVQFEGADWMVHWGSSGAALNINLAQPITVQIVASARPYPGYGAGLIGGVGGGTGPGFAVSITPDGTLTFYAGIFGANFAGHGHDQHTITAVFNGASSLQRVDEVQIGTNNYGTNEWTRPQIGITHQLHDMTVCEIVFYNRVLTGPEITYNEDLLRAKWYPAAGTWTGSAATVTIHGAARTWYTGTAPAFQPTDIETCFAWWDASDASTFTYSSGVSVSQWRDKTSAVRQLRAPNVPTEPDRTGTINGLAVVDFDGAAWMLIDDPGFGPGQSLAPQPNTIFVVAATQTGGFYGLIGGAEGAQIQRRGDTNMLAFDSGVPTGYAMDTSVHVITGVFDRLGSRQRIDGVEVGAVNTGPVNFGEMRFGSSAYAGATMFGQIAEVVIYSRNLTPTEIGEVEGYLMGKWFTPPGPQTWTRTAATMSITGTSSEWSLGGLPGAPTLTTATAGNAQVALAWTAGTSGGTTLLDYIIEKSPNGTSSWTTVSESVSAATSYTVTGLTNGVIQYFRVSAVNVTGTGPTSNVLSATPIGAPLGVVDFSTFPNGAPAGFSTLSGGGDLWVASGVMRVHAGGSTTDGYFGKEIYNTPDDDNLHVFEVEASMTTTADVLVLRCCSTVNESSFLSITVNGNGTWASGYEGGGAASGSWTYPGHGVHFTVKIEHLGLGSCLFTFNGGTPVAGTLYDRAGTYSNLLMASGARIHKWGFPNGLTGTSPTAQTWTGSASAVAVTATSGVWDTVGPPGAPTLDTATAGNAEVALDWTAPVTTGGSAITDYLIEKSPTGSSSWATVTDGTSTVSAYTVTSLTNGIIQYFRVSAINANGTGTASNVLSATPSATGPTPPAIGSGLKAWGDANISGHLFTSGGMYMFGDITQASVMGSPSSGDNPATGTSGASAAVVFDGTDWLLGRQSGSLSSDYATGAAPYSWIIYFECTATAGSFNEITGWERTYLYIHGDDNKLWWHNTSFSTTLAKNTLVAAGGVSNGSSSSQWVNGTKIGTTTSSGNNSQWRLGGPNDKPRMKVIRYAFYEAALSDANMIALSSWATNG